MAWGRGPPVPATPEGHGAKYTLGDAGLQPHGPACPALARDASRLGLHRLTAWRRLASGWLPRAGRGALPGPQIASLASCLSRPQGMQHCSDHTPQSAVHPAVPGAPHRPCGAQR
jgi:hypothetical protein